MCGEEVDAFATLRCKNTSDGENRHLLNVKVPEPEPERQYAMSCCEVWLACRSDKLKDDRDADICRDDGQLASRVRVSLLTDPYSSLNDRYELWHRHSFLFMIESSIVNIFIWRIWLYYEDKPPNAITCKCFEREVMEP